MVEARVAVVGGSKCPVDQIGPNHSQIGRARYDVVYGFIFKTTAAMGAESRQRVYADRVARGDCHHCNFDFTVVAGGSVGA